jgi:hypothetical protein
VRWDDLKQQVLLVDMAIDLPGRGHYHKMNFISNSQ